PQCFFFILLPLICCYLVPAESTGEMHNTETGLIEAVAVLSSALLVVPGDPATGPFYLVRGLLTVLKDLQW
ncbi:MAG: hypothetical protein ACK41O_27210, partial [Runella zeae]